ncbi:hypothetical protein HAX54_036036 [Datura stramonium]|uniref:Uncharacterized protein n=1 Tax=Datura stramonium TaxID=4076 RepID=A0ABS8VK43_DATST|nr:hypothetical protein [Datura stramonium]
MIVAVGLVWIDSLGHDHRRWFGLLWTAQRSSLSRIWYCGVGVKQGIGIWDCCVSWKSKWHRIDIDASSK